MFHKFKAFLFMSLLFFFIGGLLGLLIVFLMSEEYPKDPKTVAIAMCESAKKGDYSKMKRYLTGKEYNRFDQTIESLENDQKKLAKYKTMVCQPTDYTEREDGIIRMRIAEFGKIKLEKVKGEWKIFDL